MRTTTPQFWGRVEERALRSLMIAMAFGVAYIGATLLTTPWAVQVVIGLWLGAVAMFALGLWGKLHEK